MSKEQRELNYEMMRYVGATEALKVEKEKYTYKRERLDKLLADLQAELQVL